MSLPNYKPGITLKDIEKSFKGQKVLHNLSLTIAPGEFISLVGPSGCGKSTLLRIISGLERQDSGSVFIGDKDCSQLRPLHRDLAMVFQSYALYPHLSVGQNIAVPLRFRKLSALQRMPVIGQFLPGAAAAIAEIKAEVISVAESLEIEGLLARKPGQLSGGQRQRVALGRAIVRQPKAFLLDEPLSNLDARLRVQMRAGIVELHQRQQTTFVYVTHDQAEAMTMSDRIAVMDKGTILQCDTPSNVYHNPANLRVAEFIGSPAINLLQGEVTADGQVCIASPGEEKQHLKVRVDAGRLQGACTIGLRPEALRLVTPSHDAAPIVNGCVTRLENHGADFFISVSVPGQKRPLLLRSDGGVNLPARVGEKVAIALDISQLNLFDQNGDAVRLHNRQVL